jgi:hypothetical protein
VSGLLRFCYLLALGTWIGEVIFFSFVAAPAIFAVLGPRAGDVVGAIFPRYYALGMGAAGTAVASALLLARRAATPRLWMGAVVVLGLGLAATVVAGAVIQPRAQRLRASLHAAGEEPGANPAFRRLHGVAIALNGTALVAGLVGLGLSAAALRH